MSTAKLEELIAFFDGENTICMECEDLEQWEGRVLKLYTEENRDDDTIMVCDLCNKVI